MNMIQNIYTEDPNEYIKNLSQVRRSIEKKVSQKLNSHSDTINLEIQRQIKQNFNKYKKNILVNQRIQLTKQHQLSQEKKRKENLQEMITNKIRMSSMAREKKKRKIIQSKKIQRLMKQAINESKKQELRKKNLQKSIEIIQKIEQKSGDYNRVPIKLRILEEQLKSSRLKSNQKTSFSLKDRVNSQRFLPKLSQNTQAMMITQPEYISQNSYLSVQEIVQKMRQIPNIKRSKSLLDFQHKKKRKNYNNEEEILQRLIEENQKDSYNKYLMKNSLSYRASNHSRLKEVKNAIQDYLKNPNSH